MSKSDRAKKRQQKRARYAKPSAPRVIGANDNIATANDDEPVTIGGVTLNARLSAVFRQAEADLEAVMLDDAGQPLLRPSSDPDKPEGEPIPDLARRREGHQALMEIEVHITEHLDGERMKAVREEIAALEKRRGYDLTETRRRDQRGKEGVEYRVKRDGLATLATTRTDRSTGEKIPPSLTKAQATAGNYFRTDYERIDPERKLTPLTLLRDGKIKGGGGEGFAKKIAESWQRVRTVHLVIAGVPYEIARGPGEDHHTRPTMPNLPAGHPAMRAIHALSEIAGKGSSISDLASGGHARARMLQDLIAGLRACQIVYGVSEPDPTG